MKTVLAIILYCGAAALSAIQAATVVCDFERDADVAAWTVSPLNVTSLQRSDLLATSGQSALMLTTPAWKKGMAEWPAIETRSPVSDWTPYNRLVVDLTNPNEEQHYFGLFVTDNKVPLRAGLHHKFDLPSSGFRRFVIPLSAFPKEIDRGQITTLHFFTERPRSDLSLHLDNLVLLRPGESLTEPDAKFVQQLGGMATKVIAAAEQKVAAGRQAAQELNGTATAGESVRAQFDPLDARLKAIRQELSSPSLTLARRDELSTELTATADKVARAISIVRFQKMAGEAGTSSGPMVVGLATSMEKILPRAMPVDVKPAKEIEISLARNEKESLQVAVLSTTGTLRKVTVSVGDLKTSDGAVLKQENIQCDVVGYIQTKSVPPYGTPHVGWWPDPILKGLGAVDIAAGDLQTFWIRLRAPKEQPAGVYRGTVTVSAEGIPSVTLRLSVRVRRFTLADGNPLPLAITFSPEDNATPQTARDQAEWRKSADYPIHAWKKHKIEWADFLADYYLTYDSLYHRGMPDFEVLTHLHRQGRLGRFNLGYYGQIGPGSEDLAVWKAEHLPRLRAAYTKAKELGLLDHAYIYGCDEAPTDLFPQVQRAAAILKEEFPGVPIMTTTYDQSYSLASPIKSMDAFCPLTPSFDPTKAAAARAAGKQVWWYICCGPHHPHANMFVEFPAIEGRLLMGPMTARQRPDGFLYYQISIWNSQRPITAGPFTDWDPRSWTTYHGDGSWICVGADGVPVPTIRLENFRDGLEDFAYVTLLEGSVRKRLAKGDALPEEEKKWLAEAQAALVVPPSLVKSMTEYSRDPAELYRWRNRIADLLDRGNLENNPPK